MKVTLNKNIQLNSVNVYLRFEKEVIRKDIQDYLNGKQFENLLVENRVKEYLKNIKIYDEKFQLTSLGNAVKENGMLPTAEEGMYQIWFTNRDSHFGSKIVYFKRVAPSREDSEEKLELKLDTEGHFLLPSENNSYSNLKLLPINDYFGQNKNNSDNISLFWVWENLEKSNYTFDGPIGRGENSIKLKPINIPCQSDLNSLIEELLPDWDKNNKRLKVRFEEISDSSKLTFDDNEYSSIWKGFNVSIQKLPLIPFNLEEAKKWRDWLLNIELEKDYYSPERFEKTVIDKNSKNELITFHLDTPKAIEFIQNTNTSKVFWHLSAPIDLNPNI